MKGKENMKKSNPKIIIRLDGGLIQEIYSDQPVEIIQLDTDIDGVEDSELILYPDGDNNDNSATAWYCRTDRKDDSHGELAPEYVNKVFKKVLPQLERD